MRFKGSGYDFDNRRECDIMTVLFTCGSPSTNLITLSPWSGSRASRCYFQRPTGGPGGPLWQNQLLNLS